MLAEGHSNRTALLFIAIDSIKSICFHPFSNFIINALTLTIAVASYSVSQLSVHAAISL